MVQPTSVPASSKHKPRRCVGLPTLLGADLPSRLVVLTGRPGTDISSLALSCATTAAAAGTPTGPISPETSLEDLGERLVAQTSGIENWCPQSGALTPDEYARTREAAAQVAALPMWVYDPTTHPPVPFEEQLAGWQATQHLQVIVLDALQLLVDMQHTASHAWERTDMDTCHALDMCSRQHDLTILAASPLVSVSPEYDAMPPTRADLKALYGDVAGVETRCCACSTRVLAIPHVGNGLRCLIRT
jgi:replicative DNA helicase